MELSFGFSAQAGPYPQTKPARVSRNRSPPPRSRSRSASIVSEPNITEDTLCHTRPPGNRGSRLGTVNRRVRFSPEADDGQVMGNTISDDPVVSGSPARAPPVTRVTQIQQSDRGSSGRASDNSMGYANPTVFRPAPTQRLRPDGGAGAIEEMSDEGESPGAVQTRNRFGRGDNIRSSIKNLLDANREAPVVDTNTATILETLLSKMDQGSGERLILSLPFVWMMTSFLDQQRTPVRMICRARAFV